MNKEKQVRENIIIKGKRIVQQQKKNKEDRKKTKKITMKEET